MTLSNSHGGAPLIQAGGLRVNRPMNPLLRQACLDHPTDPARSPVDHPDKVPLELFPNKNVQDRVEAAVRVCDALGDLQRQPNALAGVTGCVDAQQLQCLEEGCNVVGSPAEQENSHHNNN